MLQLMMSWLCESHEGKMALPSPEVEPLLFQASEILERLADRGENPVLLLLCPHVLLTCLLCRSEGWCAPAPHSEHKVGVGVSCRKPRAICSACHHLLCSLSAGADGPTLPGYVDLVLNAPAVPQRHGHAAADSHRL